MRMRLYQEVLESCTYKVAVRTSTHVIYKSIALVSMMLLTELLILLMDSSMQSQMSLEKAIKEKTLIGVCLVFLFCGRQLLELI